MPTATACSADVQPRDWADACPAQLGSALVARGARRFVGPPDPSAGQSPFTSLTGSTVARALDPCPILGFLVVPARVVDRRPVLPPQPRDPIRVFGRLFLVPCHLHRHHCFLPGSAGGAHRRPGCRLPVPRWYAPRRRSRRRSSVPGGRPRPLPWQARSSFLGTLADPLRPPLAIRPLRQG